MSLVVPVTELVLGQQDPGLPLRGGSLCFLPPWGCPRQELTWKTPLLLALV